jgi:hypothetical protein
MSRRVQPFTLIIGSLLAMVIVCAQYFHFEASSFSKKEIKTGQQESSQPADEAMVSLPSFSLPAPVHVQLNLDAYCLFEILFEEDQQLNSSAEAPVYPEKLLITLFRFIISPNAP